MNHKDRKELKDWFLLNRRDLPWREYSDPYAIWISEVMLQQTQVSVVIPYFERWMNRFPTINSLAEASIEEVLKMWEGLGYYSRARNLHEGARYAVNNFGGILPRSVAALRKIKGLGSYTIGAILNFAFHERAAAVDSNVLRVLTRYYALEDDVSKQKTVKKIEQMTEQLLPEEEPWITSEALIELGAAVCTKNPKCSQCPLINGCTAFQKGIFNRLPVKSGKVATIPLYRAVAVIVHEDKLLVGRGLKGKVMADLCEFPYFELEQPVCDKELIIKKVFEHIKIKTFWKRSLTEVKHCFTHYRARLFPHLLRVEKIQDTENYEWISWEPLKRLPFSSGHRRIFFELQKFI